MPRLLETQLGLGLQSCQRLLFCKSNQHTPYGCVEFFGTCTATAVGVRTADELIGIVSLKLPDVKVCGVERANNAAMPAVVELNLSDRVQPQSKIIGQWSTQGRMMFAGRAVTIVPRGISRLMGAAMLAISR